jgi:hypothetical protein
MCPPGWPPTGNHGAGPLLQPSNQPARLALNVSRKPVAPALGATAAAIAATVHSTTNTRPRIPLLVADYSSARPGVN